MIQLFQRIKDVILEDSMIDLGVVQLKIGLYSLSDDLLTLEVGMYKGCFLLWLIEDLKHLFEIISDDGLAALFSLFILLLLWCGAIVSVKRKDGKRY